ncbi:hypothetical protein [Actinomadura algeriensis]|uniref:Uncharacterized protein n=1 Tax=Actinomadura algeriensis TaxID=1679523 RepID=A0ABR9K5Y9_9ACTN|nr:hypothetical protein [Actinomadura algeriensis]MBE1538006.1 hypothetical protein [Actinomadura algeriensis]
MAAHAQDPASAAKQAPVAVTVQKDKQCAETLGILKEIRLLPGRPNLAKTLCTLVTEQPASEAPPNEEPPGGPQQATLLQMPRDYTPPAAGQPTRGNTQTHDVAEHQEKLLALPAKWPAGLTVWIPTFHNGEWHSYSNKNDTAEAGKAEAGKADAGAPVR